jgi:hypothetical protein
MVPSLCRCLGSLTTSDLAWPYSYSIQLHGPSTSNEVKVANEGPKAANSKLKFDGE